MHLISSRVIHFSTDGGTAFMTNGNYVTFVVDNGAAVTLIEAVTWDKIAHDILLETWTGHLLVVVEGSQSLNQSRNPDFRQALYVKTDGSNSGLDFLELHCDV